MARLAKVLQGQAQPGLKAFKKGGKVMVDVGNKGIAGFVDEDPKAKYKKGGKVKDTDKDAMKCGGSVKKCSGGKVK
jgi:hypothetical protein